MSSENARRAVTVDGVPYRSNNNIPFHRTVGNFSHFLACGINCPHSDQSLVPASFWCQHVPDTSKCLVPARFCASKSMVSTCFWYQQVSDTSKTLVPENLWCQKVSDTNKCLVSTCICYQPVSYTSKSLAPASLWYRHVSDASKSLAPASL